MNHWESWNVGNQPSTTYILLERACMVPHLLCQYDQDGSCLVCFLDIYPSLQSTRKHISASHLARGRIEAAQQLSYLFPWQSRSGTSQVNTTNQWWDQNKNLVHFLQTAALRVGSLDQSDKHSLEPIGNKNSQARPTESKLQLWGPTMSAFQSPPR